MLILKQNAANTVPSPPAGKGTIFLDDSDTLSVKTSDGNVETFPTVAASNSQVVFMNGTSLSGEAALTYNFNTNVLNVSGNVAAGNVLTDNLLYANGTAWDLSDPGGNNTEIQFNDSESFGGSAALTFNKTSNVLTLSGNLSAGNVTGANLVSANFVTGTLTTAAQPNITSVGNLTDLNVAGNALITGNLTVNGNVVYVNVETLDVEDPIIVLGGGPNGAAPVSDDGKDRGSQLQYFSGTAKNAFMGWDNSNAEFGMGSVVTVTNEVVTFTTYGNLRVGNIIGNGQALTGMNGANVTGTVANATHASTANTVVDAAQPNITSVGTLSSLSVTGNTTSNNFNATTYITASSIYANTGSVGANYISAAIDVTANRDVLAGNVFANAGIIGGNTGNFSGNISANGVKTNNLYYANGSPWDLSDPGGSNTQIQFNDDESFGGSAAFTFDKSSNLVTVSANLNANNLNATTHVTAGNVYANSGTVGASLLTGTLTTASQPNVTSLGTLSSLSVTGNAGANNFNATTHVTAGNVWANSGTVGASLLTGTLTTASQPNITSVGTLSSLAVTGNVTAANIYANSGTIGASLLTGTLTTASQPNVTSLGTLSSLGVSGNITATNITANTGVFTGNGSGLSAIAGANVTGTVANATHASTANTVVDAAQPNITSVGTLTSLAVTGNATANNFTGANLVSANFVTGTLTTAAQPNITSVGTLTGLTVDGSNINLANGVYVGNGSGLSALAGGNVTGQVANALVAGTVYTAAQPNITSVGTLSSLTVSGNANVGNLGTAQVLASANVTAPQFISNIADGTAPLVVTSTTKVANLNADLLDGYDTATAATANTVVIRDANGSFSANIITGNLSGAATTAGTVTTNAQPNITSVGTLSSLAVTANVTAGNVYANSGTIGASLLTGTLTTAAQPNITSVGTLTGLGVNGTITGVNITANTGVFTGNGSGLSALAGANVTGQVANALVAGTVYTNAQPNITSVGTLSSLAVTGNVTAGNVYANSGTIGASLLTGTLTTAAQPNVTSLGTLTGLGVNGNITAANITANTGVFTGNGSGLSALAGANVTGQVGNALVAGTVYTNAQPNITSLGTLSSVAVTGNATAGNVYANSGTIGASLLTGTLTTAAQPNITSVGTLTSLSVTGNVAAGNLTTTGVLSVTGTGVSSIAGNLDMTSNNIINLAAPVNSTDAATKQYVDDVAQGLHTHDSCNAATDGTLATISGGTVTYNNGSSGVGATLTTTGSYTTIDGVTLTNGMRILVKNEANTAHNGIYDRTSSTVLTRSTDFDTPTEMAGGDFTFVNAGTLYDNTGWVMPDPVTTVGTSAVVWVQFSGAGTYTAGTGLTLTGSQFSVNASQTQITSVGTLTGLSVNGNITAANITANTGVFTGNGSGLTALAGGNVTGQVGNALVAGTVYTAAQPNITSVGTLSSLSVTGNVSAGNLSGTLLAGTLTTAAQPNITSVGTLTGLGVNGTITGVNITANTGVFTGNGSGLTALAGGNVTGQVANALVAGTVYTAAQPNITSVGTLSSVAVTGNVTAGNVYANSGTVGASLLTGTLTTAAQPNITSVGTLSSLTIAANGDINMSGTGSNINGVALVSATLFEGSGANLTNLNASNISSGTLAQARLANSSLTVNGTSISLGGSGTITANTTQTLTLGSYLTGTSFNGGTAVTAAVDATTTNTASKVVARDSSGNFAAGTITATLSGAATTAGTVTTAAQPNITSVSTSFTSLTFANAQTITGNNITFSTGANTNAGTLTGNFTLSTGSRLQATYADLAEKYAGDASYEVGTVLVFGGDQEVTIATEYDSHRVAGVVSENAAYIMNSGIVADYPITLALTGRVPVKVHGPVAKGDLMVTGPNGHAVVNNMARAGTILGKALQNFEGGSGIIEVVVGRV